MTNATATRACWTLTWLLASCAAAEPEAIPAAPVPTYTDAAAPLGLCPVIREDAATGDTLALAARANDRGCPRLALTALAPLVAQRGELTPEEAAQLLLHGAEARRQIFADGFIKTGPPAWTLDWDFASWMWMGAPQAGPAAGELIEVEPAARRSPEGVARILGPLQEEARQLAGAVGDGRLPAEILTSGRLHEATFRSVGSLPCTQTWQADGRATIAAFASDLRWGFFDQLALAGNDPGQNRSTFRALAWDCDRDRAAPMAMAAMEGFAGAKDQVAGQQTALELIEHEIFPSGTADAWVMAELDENDIADWAGRDEAGRAGAGPHAAAAARLRQALDGLARDFPASAATPSTRSRIAYLRATSALRHRGDPEAAAGLAAEALGEALVAERADLADAARALGVVALAESGDIETADAVLAALTASLEERGAEASRVHLASRLRLAGRLWIERGEVEIGDRLLDRGQRLVPGVRSNRELVAQIATRGRSLAMAGRVEASLAEYDQALVRLDELRGRLIASTVGPLRESLHRERSELLGSVGQAGLLAVDISATEGLDLYALQEALDRNDGRAARRWLAPPGSTPDDQRARQVVALVAGLCGSVAVHLPELTTWYEGLVEQAELTLAAPEEESTREARSRQRSELLAVQNDVVPALVSCLAQQRRADLLARVQEVAGRVGKASGLGALSGPERRAYEAFRAEAEGKYGAASDGLAYYADALAAAMGLKAKRGVSLATRAGPIYERAALAALAAQPPDLEQAVRLIERARARELKSRRERSVTGSWELTEGPVAEVETRLQRLQIRLRSLAHLHAAATDRTVRQALAAQQDQSLAALRVAQRAHTSARRRYAEAEPWRSRLLALGNPPSLDQLQSRLAADETLLYYLFGIDAAWAVLVTADGAKAVALRAVDRRGGLPRLRVLLELYGNQLVAALRATRNAGIDGAQEQTAALEASARELYDLMVKPLEPHLPAQQRVILVPPPLLSGLPIAAIGGDRPWIERNPLRLLPSARLLDPPGEPRPPTWRAVVAGDPAFSNGGGTTGAGGGDWRSISDARLEVIEVAALYGARPLLGEEATEERVLVGAAEGEVLHLANHARTDGLRPERSALRFASRGENGAADGFLYADEIEGLNLAQRLVVLSAAEAANGQPRGRAGQLPIDWAFLLAGTSGVVSSRWLGDAEANRRLLIELHRGLLAGTAADVALARAMRTVRAEKNWRAPYYWAGWGLLGPGLR